MVVDRDLYATRVRYAVEVCRDARTLALILNVPVQSVERWEAGLERPPADIFLKIVDLLLRVREMPGGAARAARVTRLRPAPR